MPGVDDMFGRSLRGQAHDPPPSFAGAKTVRLRIGAKPPSMSGVDDIPARSLFGWARDPAAKFWRGRGHPA